MIGSCSLAALIALPILAVAQNTAITPGPDGKYELKSEGIRAKFIPYGATVSNIFITDVHGVERDVVLGFDNATYYSESRLHPHLNGVPGRYANRIKNSTFTIDGTAYHVNPNDNGGLDTLHGGSPCFALPPAQQAYCSVGGWDWRNWTVTTASSSSISFGLVDPAGTNGFPGEVIANVTYTLTPHRWHLVMEAKATTAKTPIMLTSHTYLNLDGFQNPNTPLALNHSIYMPYSGQRIGTDGILIPNGTIVPNFPQGANDFWQAPKQLGAGFTSPDIVGNCGTNCTGFDNCFLVNRAQYGPYHWHDSPVVTVGSPYSGIQIDIYTPQQAAQMYSCNNMNGTLALKETQGFFNDSSRPRVVEKYGCVVFEAEDWIDAINQPEWQRDRLQIFGPEDPPYRFEAIYDFSLNRTLAGMGNYTASPTGSSGPGPTGYGSEHNGYGRGYGRAREYGHRWD